MNLLSSLLSLANVDLSASAANKRAALECAAGLLGREPGVDASLVLDRFVEREALASTGLGRGVAVPHARVAGLQHARAALVRLQRPVAFDACDNRPVQLIVALIVPEQAPPQQHLDLLCELAQLLSDPQACEQLMTASQPRALLASLAAWEPMRPAA